MSIDVKKVECDAEQRNVEKSVGGGEKKERLFEAIGEFGLWQIVLVSILAIPCKMSATWQLMGIIFLAPKTQHRCILRTNSTEEMILNQCYDDCEQFAYITDFPDSIITTFELVCARAWLANFAQMMVMLGVLVGSMVFGFIADRYGRRKALLIAATMQLVLSLVVSLSPKFWAFILIKFLLGSSSAGLMVTSFVIVIEITGPSRREFVSAFYHVPIAMAEVIMPALAFYFRSWTAFSLSVGVPNIVFLLYFMVPESPRWLISTGRLKEASKVMESAARRNKLPPCNYLEVAQSIVDDLKVSAKENQTSVSYIDLMIHPKLRVKNVLSCITWFILGIVYYGGKQYIGQTSSNVFISIALAGVLQVPGQIISGYFLKRFGRRRPAIAFFLVCGVCNGLLALPDDWFYLKIVTGTVAVSAAAGAFTTVYTFTSELFPTVARNMAVGASSTTSRVGSMLAPFIAGMSVTQGAWIPPTVFATAPLLAIIACWCLPETKGRQLEDTLELN